MVNRYTAVIGFETHIQVLTKTKLFCGCKNIFGAPPNSVVCPICLGMPGVLPALNIEVVKKAIKTAIILNCTINEVSFFDRKNYFYPDIPKSYQITQYHKPIAQNGYVELSTGKKIRIKRFHIEEDVGKLLHPELGKAKDGSYDLGIIRADYSFVDMNRSGVPLFEIVTEPDIENSEEGYEYLVNLKRLLQFSGISNCDMEKGQLRCDVNISIKKIDSDTLSNRVEIKNLNSFKFVKDAINFEIARQIET
ncbi:MAG: Asp-tRNA(Asn)/Glu-tRNA(Gln) amidotransferase subunit GatB, partial [Planctomycetota bacterium]